MERHPVIVVPVALYSDNSKVARATAKDHSVSLSECCSAIATDMDAAHTVSSHFRAKCGVVWRDVQRSTAHHNIAQYSIAFCHLFEKTLRIPAGISK